MSESYTEGIKNKNPSGEDSLIFLIENQLLGFSLYYYLIIFFCHYLNVLA